LIEALAIAIDKRHEEIIDSTVHFDLSVIVARLIGQDGVVVVEQGPML
jgi:hypothetical protein